MRHSAVDKRVAGIIRWLERLKKSYKDGAIESALMEAECARADIETLRNDVWQRVKPVRHKSSGIMTRMFKRISLAVIIIMFYVAPLAKDKVPVQSVSDEIKAVMPPKPIEIIRITEQPQDKPEPKAQTQTQTSRRASRKASSQSGKRAVNTKVSSVSRTESAKTVPYDKVFSLVQTGQRALKENSSVISVKKHKEIK